jgi:hypothetical protein
LSNHAFPGQWQGIDLILSRKRSVQQLERAGIFIFMYTHELNDFTGWTKKKPKKPGVKKRRSYRKPIGQNYRKSGDFVVTTQPVQPVQSVDFVSLKSWESWCAVNFGFFCCGMLYTFIARLLLSSVFSSSVIDYIAIILGLGSVFLMVLVFGCEHTLKAKCQLIIMILPSGLISVFVLIYCFGFGNAKPINRGYNSPHYYNASHYHSTPRGYTILRDYAPAPRDYESGHALANITHHENPPPDYDNTLDVGDSALCRDGTYSYSQHARGTCSHHSGVLRWDHYPGLIIPGRNPNPPSFFNYRFEPSLSPDIGRETGIEKYQRQTIDRIPGTPVCQKPMVFTEHDGCQPKSRIRG